MTLLQRIKCLYWLSGLEWDTKRTEKINVPSIAVSREKRMATIIEMNKPDYFPNEEQDENSPG